MSVSSGEIAPSSGLRNRQKPMKAVRLQLIMLAAVCLALPAWAEDLHTAVKNCGWCHGMLGQGIGVAPRLAGQRHQYILRQLGDLAAHVRNNPQSRQYMWGPATNLDPLLARDLAGYLASLPFAAAADGRPQLAEVGRAIYQDGVPEANIVSCAACHGPNAEGIGDIPRLGGLGFSYLRRRLEQWGEGYHIGAKAPMPHIAAKLSPDDVDALASYLSFVR
jgi:cytochrome c553